MLSRVKCVLESRSLCFESIPILNSCVTLGKLLKLSKSQFPHLHNRCNKVTVIIKDDENLKRGMIQNEQSDRKNKSHL